MCHIDEGTYYKLRVFENRVLRKILARNRRDKLDDLCWSSKIIGVIVSRRMKLTGHVTRMEEGRNAYRILVGKPKGKRPMGRPRNKWDYYIKMQPKETEWESVV
jgi:hypothetical protein